MRTIFNFIVKSSADPKATSLTVKALLVGTIPFILTTLDVVCAVGQYCFDVDRSGLEMAVEGIVQTVYYVTLAFASIGGTYGLLRKLWRTARGENLAIRQ